MNEEHQELEPGQTELDAADEATQAVSGELESGETIDSLRQKLADAEKQTLLYQADLENFRRRKSKEMQDSLRYASLPLVESLLQVLDNLERALQSAAEENDSASLQEGVQLVSNQLLAALEGHGCKRIEALGQLFDPNRHEAIQMQPGEQPANTIVMEVQSGFMLHDRVVRPAKVIISTGPANA